MTLVTQDLEYSDDGTTLDGVVVLDAARSDRRPGILLIHGGAGLDDHARGQAHRYAELGYVVLACDMYGRGIAGNRERVMATLIGLRDAPDRLAQRAAAGLAALSARAEVNGYLAAVGFCFGGMAALRLARSGASLAAVVSMHGSLATTNRAEPGAVTAKVLVCHGALDPHVPMADVVAFTGEMTEAGADWQVNVYGGAMHGFTHAHAVDGRRRVSPTTPKPTAARSRPHRPSWTTRSRRVEPTTCELTRHMVAGVKPPASSRVAGMNPGSLPYRSSLRASRAFPASSPGKGGRSFP
jgi:dienelactone hydrolase